MDLYVKSLCVSSVIVTLLLPYIGVGAFHCVCTLTGVSTASARLTTHTIPSPLLEYTPTLSADTKITGAGTTIGLSSHNEKSHTNDSSCLTLNCELVLLPKGLC